jgi:hypothetical protein
MLTNPFPISTSYFLFPIFPFPISYFPFPIPHFLFPIFPFPISYFPFPIPHFLFPIPHFLFPISPFPISYFSISYFLFPIHHNIQLPALRPSVYSYFKASIVFALAALYDRSVTVISVIPIEMSIAKTNGQMVNDMLYSNVDNHFLIKI